MPPRVSSPLLHSHWWFSCDTQALPPGLQSVLLTIQQLVVGGHLDVQCQLDQLQVLVPCGSVAWLAFCRAAFGWASLTLASLVAMSSRCMALVVTASRDALWPLVASVSLVRLELHLVHINHSHPS